MNDLIDQLRAALHTVWNRRWLALAVAWGVCVLGWTAVAFVPNTYESSARIFVDLDDPLAQQIGLGSGNRKEDVERVRQVMTGAVSLEKVIRSTSLGKDITTDRQMQGAVAGLGKQIQIVSTQDNLFQITAQSGRSDFSDGENAKLSQDIVQKMIDIFREENLAGSRGEMHDTLSFMDQQLASRQKQLEAAEQKRLIFETQHPELVGGTQALLSKIEGMRSQIRNIDADIAAAQSALAAINGQLAGTPRTMIVPGQSGGAKGALMQAQSDLAGMKARGLTDEHPDVVSLQRQIDSLRKMAATQPDVGSPNPAYTSLQSIASDRQATVQALTSRRAALQSELMSIEMSQSTEPQIAAEAQRISRDYDVLRKQYDELLQDREQLRLRGQVENERSGVKFEVLDPPVVPRSPSAPNRPLLLFGVLFLAAGIGAGVAYALNYMKSTFATAGQLERGLDLEVLGTISQLLTDATRSLRIKRNKQFMAASGALVGLFMILLVTEFVQRGSVA